MEKLDVIKELMDFDLEFSRDSQTEKVNAWASRIAENAIMITGGHRDNIIGREHIIKGLEGLYSLPKLKFIWEPTFANGSDDLNLGYTSGIYTREYFSNNKLIKEIGKYTTIWKKINNKWKMIHDIGNLEKVEED